ncbi:MAG: four helix bundle protein [Treponema sp.]|nr:four helix bundle protein [Treponema sp.]
MSDSLVLEKSEDFALRIVRLYKNLVFEQKEFILSKQILRSGTSIGANISEGVYAQSKPDFIHKYSIALKEANETKYWLNLLTRSGYFTDDQLKDLKNSLQEIIKIISSIIITTKQKTYRKYS